LSANHIAKQFSNIFIFSQSPLSLVGTQDQSHVNRNGVSSDHLRHSKPVKGSKGEIWF